MSILELPTHVMDKLTAIAAQEERTPAEIVETWLEHYPILESLPVDPLEEDYPLGSVARLALELKKEGFSSAEPNIGKRSREILENDFAEYLVQRWKGDNNPHG